MIILSETLKHEDRFRAFPFEMKIGHIASNMGKIASGAKELPKDHLDLLASQARQYLEWSLRGLTGANLSLLYALDGFLEACIAKIRSQGSLDDSEVRQAYKWRQAL